MEKRGRGRPAFTPTAAQKRDVQEMVSCGMSQEEMARALGICEETLVKHFEEELKTGRAKKRAEVIRMLYRTARAGNVSAQKKLEELTSLAEADARVRDREKPKAAAAPSGKKEQQQQAADQAAQGRYQPPGPPKLIVSNG